MLEEELNEIRNLHEYRELAKQSKSLKIMSIIQLIFYFFIIIPVFIVFFYHNILVFEDTLSDLLALVEILSILIFFMLSKPINKVKADFKNNYYNIVLLPILRKVNYTLSYVKNDKASMKNKTFLNNVRLDTIIENFYKKTSLNFDLVIKNNRIYFRIFSGNKFREPLFGKLINERKLSDYYDTLKFIEEITTEIVKS